VDSKIKGDNGFNIKAFSSDVIWFSLGQFILLIIGFIQSLIIPKYLSTVDYGYWQIFLLAMTYMGIFHIGFLDGILVRWAGKNINELVFEIPVAFKFIILELVVIICLLISCLWLFEIPSKEILTAVLINSFIGNLLVFFLFLGQATKRFRLVAIANIGKGVLFLSFIIIIFFYGLFSYSSLIIATMITGIVLILIFCFYFRNYLCQSLPAQTPLFQYGKENIGIDYSYY
jgi:O-antigen/teichoic acid export membrane protein